MRNDPGWPYLVLSINAQGDGSQVLEEARRCEASKQTLDIAGRPYFVAQIAKGELDNIWQVLLSTSPEEIDEMASPQVSPTSTSASSPHAKAGGR
jgi:hypothetical protein